MHPNRAFRFDSDDAIINWAVARGFAHIFAATAEGLMVAHAPIIATGPRSLRFHLARGNRITSHLDGARLLISVTGPDGYITPNWYAEAAQSVPTWNYIAAEIEGVARVSDEDELVAQLDALAAMHEPRLSPDQPWTRDKMDDSRFRAMLKAIIGFEVTIDTVRGTTKLSQNRSADDHARVIIGLRDTGHHDLADTMDIAQ